MPIRCVPISIDAMVAVLRPSRLASSSRVQPRAFRNSKIALPSAVALSSFFAICHLLVCAHFALTVCLLSQPLLSLQ